MLALNIVAFCCTAILLQCVRPSKGWPLLGPASFFGGLGAEPSINYFSSMVRHRGNTAAENWRRRTARNKKKAPHASPLKPCLLRDEDPSIQSRGASTALALSLDGSATLKMEPVPICAHPKCRIMKTLAPLESWVVLWRPYSFHENDWRRFNSESHRCLALRPQARGCDRAFR